MARISQRSGKTRFFLLTFDELISLKCDLGKRTPAVCDEARRVAVMPGES